MTSSKDATYCSTKPRYGYDEQGNRILLSTSSCPRPKQVLLLNSSSNSKQISTAMRRAQRLKYGLKLR